MSRGSSHNNNNNNNNINNNGQFAQDTTMSEVDKTSTWPTALQLQHKKQVKML